MQRKSNSRGSRRSEALVLSDTPERVRLRALVRELEQKRDKIAEAELELETLQAELYSFERSYQQRLKDEHEELRQVQAYVRHLERWLDLLKEPATPQVVKRAERLQKRREIELQTPVATPEAVAELENPDQELKQLYRSLARRYHPDLARNEEERVQFGGLMTRINELYRTGDSERLKALFERAKGGEVSEPEASTEQQIAALEQRNRWFDQVLRSLFEERSAMEQSPTCALKRNVEQAEVVGRDIIAELKSELVERVQVAYEEIVLASDLLENQVRRYNQRGANPKAGDQLSQVNNAQALQKHFDPYADKSLIRLGLDSLAAIDVSPASRALASQLSERAANEPWLLRLVLLTYVSELSPFALPGLENYQDFKFRFDFLERGEDGEDGEALSDEALASALILEQALVAAADLVEYGARFATEQVAFVGLRFRRPEMKEAVHLLLTNLSVRREFRRVLSVVGKLAHCDQCGGEVFSLPLFRTRGIDNLRALVCPNCATTLSSYWMPKGKDVQAVLNDAFIDLEMVSEWSFALGRSSIAMQLLPSEVEELSLGDLRQRLFQEVFARYAIAIEASAIELYQNNTLIADTQPLADLTERTFIVRLSDESGVKVGAALEQIRHRVSAKFRNE